MTDGLLTEDTALPPPLVQLRRRNWGFGIQFNGQVFPDSRLLVAFLFDSREWRRLFYPLRIIHLSTTSTDFHEFIGKVDDNTRSPLSVVDEQGVRPRRPPRRIGHLSTKSSSAVPTLSTLSIAPSRAPPTAPQSPTKPQNPRSWITRRASMATAQNSQLTSHAAADLLRQAMLHG